MSSFIEMPKLSDTMTEGTVVKWHKTVGDTVQMGDVVAEVETDKAVMELEAFGEGTLSEVCVPEGGKAQIGQKLAVLTAPGEGKLPKQREHPMAGQAPVSSASSSPPQPAVPSEAKGAKAGPTRMPALPEGGRVKVSPFARKLAAARGVELGSIQGSGPGGRVVARDIEAAGGQVAEPAAAPAAVRTAVTPAAVPAPRPAAAPTVTAAAPSGPTDKRIALTGMRKVIADRLLASKTQIPHFYLNIEVDASELVRLRAQVNGAMEKAGLGKLTFNDFILKAAVMAARRVPRVNAAFVGEAIIEYGNIHLAVAVAVEEGLVTPVIREAQKKSVREISEAVKDLANRARSKKLKPEEYQGGTLTVTNLGSYGIESFSAIINPPQSLILSVGAIVKKPVIDAAGQVVAGERMALGLSADHRVVDGAIGAQYLAELRQLLENPTLLLI